MAALGRLVGDVEPFVATVFGRRPLHVAGADPDGFRDLLSLDDVDHVVAETGLRAPAFRLVRDGTTLPRDAVTRRVRIGSRPVDDLADVAAVHREFAAGATVVLQGLHRSWAPVARFCRTLEEALTHRVQANAYLTPPVAQGLHLHGDPHDVFAVQTHGVKRWVVHPPGGDEPWDLELRPGDVLYLPAGTRHAAQTVDQPSLHLTLGVRTVAWRDVVRHAVDAVLDDPTLETSLPVGWAEAPAELVGTLRGHLDALFSRLTDDLDASAPLIAAAEAFWSGRAPDLSGGLRDILEVDRIDDTTRLVRRWGTTARLEPADDHVTVDLGARQLRLPATTEAVLRRLLAADTIVPKELDDLIDEPSRLVLCRRLVREGLLAIDRGERADRA